MGSCRPDFLLDLRCRETGECKRLIVDALGSSDEAHLLAKAAARSSLLQIAPVLSVMPADIEQDRLVDILRKELGV